jgi:hypothetical protein
MRWQDEEKKLRPGTTKHAAFMLLKEAGPAGMLVTDMADQAIAKGLKDDWGANGKRHLREVRATWARPCAEQAPHRITC